MTTDPQGEIFKFLGRPETHGGNTDVKRIETHGAVLFLAGGDVYKVKRARKFPFMDYSTLEKRHKACLREIEINKPNAPSIYLDAVPITESPEGLTLNGPGKVREWAVHMRRFDEDMTLDQVLARDGLPDMLIEKIARIIVAAHEKAAAHRRFDFARALAGILKDNRACLAGQAIDAFDLLDMRAQAALRRVDPLLRDRARQGFVRRGHGDLHLRNIALIEGAPTLFDAIEFDEALATTDLLYDLAFLLMDLCQAGAVEKANLLLNRYLVESREDAHYAALAALPLFIATRAAIRAKVAAFLSPPDQAAMRHYSRLGANALDPQPPMLLAIGGLSGSGKTTLARKLAPHLLPLPGAVHLRSDVIRKQLYDWREFSPLPEAAYEREITEKVYARLRELAETALKAGYSVIVDAVHQQEAERAALEAIAVRHVAEFTGIWLDAPTDILCTRVESRHNDASDATAAVVERQAERQRNGIHWRRIDASQDIESMARQARALWQGVPQAPQT